MTLNELITLAEHTAEAVGKHVLLGMRPNGRGCFAHCDGIEYDGPWEDSLPAVINAIRGNAAEDQRKERREIDLARLSKIVQNLPRMS